LKIKKHKYKRRRTMSFEQGLSGLAAQSKNLDVIGNNVANASTYGFKSSEAVFADVYAASLQGGGSANQNVGIGVKTEAVVQQFTQGNISSQSNPLDLAINGGGFFQLSTNGAVSYSRNGQFQLEKNGYIVNATGDKLKGYPADAAGNITAGSPVEIKLDLANIIPSTTTKAKAQVNLDSSSAVPATAFSVTDPTSFNYTTSMTVYDSLGNAHTFSSYYVKTASNAWTVNGAIDGTLLAAPLGNLAFNPDGTLNSAGSTVPMTVTQPLANGANPLNFTLDYSNSTQFGASNAVNLLTQDGYTSGQLSGFQVGTDGAILGRYSNGQSKNLAQVALANFVAPNGLAPIGDNKWTESSSSGQPLIGVPGSSSLGVLQASALENSNVDLTRELVNLITAQRNYQANAQTIKAQDTVLQTLINGL
jgi:flagellar hook protein FlgE